MVAGFLSDPGTDLAERLLRALEGGRDAGGQIGLKGPITERSAWVRVIDTGYVPLLDSARGSTCIGGPSVTDIYSAFCKEKT